MVAELLPGANLALPDGEVWFLLDGPFDLSALVVGESGTVAGDADLVFYNAPAAPGVTLAGGRLAVTPARLRSGAARVVVVATPEDVGARFTARPAPVLADGSGRSFARLRPPRPGTETLLLLAEVYRRDGRWRVRAIGQGYADGLAGLARDFGVDVADDGTGSGDGDGVADLVIAVVAATNAERARHGLAPFTADPRLHRAAQDHSGDMVRRGFFAHENPDGAQVWHRAVAAGYGYRKVAENIAAGQRTAADVVRGWMDSPGHRANILDAELTHIGVGHALGGSFGVYWTQVFGTPR